MIYNVKNLDDFQLTNIRKAEDSNFSEAVPPQSVMNKTIGKLYQILNNIKVKMGSQHSIGKLERSLFSKLRLHETGE